MVPTEVMAPLRESFESGLTRPLHWRRGQLRQLKRLLTEGEDELLDALAADLGKPRTEAWLSELALTLAEIDVMIDHLEEWAAPEKVKVPMLAQPGKAEIVREPLGVVLVIAPWNYPVQLLVLPMAAAVAAGNCVVGKPSEVVPKVSAAIA